MKRVLVALLVLLMVGPAALAENAGIDLSGKTVDELIAIKQAVDEALFEQGGKVVLPQGILVVGKDIAAGSYVIEVHGVKEAKSYQHFTIVIWESEEAREEARKAYAEDPKTDMTRYMIYRNSFVSGDIARVSVTDSQVLMCHTDIEGATMTIEKVSGLFMD